MRAGIVEDGNNLKEIIAFSTILVSVLFVVFIIIFLIISLVVFLLITA